MRVVGIICEYNPFHHGHALHIARARELAQADYVICIMSGPVTQRGVFARHDKWLRTRMALASGADLVLELPVRFAASSAGEFARGGVSSLAACGVLTHLSFGVEEAALPFLGHAVSVLSCESAAFSGALRTRLDAGLSYPQARAQAAELTCGLPGLADALALPNASLALEYLLALPAQIAPVPVARAGGGYHDATLTALSSATAVRAALSRGDLAAACAAVPCGDLLAHAETSGAVHEEESLTQTLLYLLRTASADTLRALPGMEEGLENRFLAAAGTALTRSDLLARIKTRRYTHTRLSRLCSALLLGMTREFCAANAAPAYLRVLGFRREARPLLRAVNSASSLPVIIKAADFDRAQPLFALDLRAQDLWSLGAGDPALRIAARDLITSPVIL